MLSILAQVSHPNHPESRDLLTGLVQPPTLAIPLYNPQTYVECTYRVMIGGQNWWFGTVLGALESIADQTNC
jgi:hypothetical protein